MAKTNEELDLEERIEILELALRDIADLVPKHSKAWFIAKVALKELK